MMLLRFKLVNYFHKLFPLGLLEWIPSLRRQPGEFVESTLPQIIE